MSAKVQKFAEALALGHTAAQAAEAAGYPRGKSSDETFAANARKRAKTKRVQKLVAELRGPAIEKLQDQIVASKEWAIQQLTEIGNLPIDRLKPRASDKINALNSLAKIEGWEKAQEHQVKGHITLHATYTVEPRPERADQT